MKIEEKTYDFKNEPGKERTKRELKNDGKPLISIITPYYNSEDNIMQTANSVFNQTFPYWEWIIVNDGSTNKNTKDTLKKLENMDSRIKVYNKENGGPAKARVFGAKKANCDLLFTLDSDDLIHNTMLETGYFSILTNPDVTWGYTPICNFEGKEFLYDPEFDTVEEKKNNVVTGNGFIKKDKLLEIEEYSNLPKGVHEDWFLWLSLMSKGYKPLRMNYYGFWYRKSFEGRLETINKDKRLEKLNKEYLNPLRKKIKTNVGAVQFPTSCNYDFNSYPYQFDIGKNPLNSGKNGKRILFMMPWAVRGGADIFNLNLLKSLKANGYEVTIITTENHYYDMRTEFEKYCEEFFDLSSFLNRKDWAAFLAHLIKSRNIDLFFQTNSFYGYYVIPWLKTIFKDVIFVDYLHAEDWSWRDGAYPRDSNAIDRFLDKTYTCTNHLKEVMYKDMNRNIKNCECVYIGADDKYYDSKNTFKEDEILKEKFKGKKVLLFPCRIVYLKRPLFVVAMMKKIVEKRKDVICLVVGNGPALKDMKNKVKQDNLQEYFEFAGMKKDMRPYYKAADVTLVCSLTEGLTLTAYESMAMGTPVISSDVGGQKELVNDDYGRVIKKYQSIEKDLKNFNYDNKEIEEYAKAFNDIVNSKKYKEIRKNCRDIIEEKFSIEVMQKRMLSEIKNLIKNGTNVKPDICNNEEFAIRYLVMFNEYHKLSFPDPDSRYNNLRQKVVDKLWDNPLYRGTVKGIKKVIKKK